MANPELLGAYLRREGLMLRRTKADVLPELPPKRRLVQEIDADDALYERLTREVLTKLRLLRDGESLTPQMRALLEDQVSQQERRRPGWPRRRTCVRLCVRCWRGAKRYCSLRTIMR